MNELKPAPRKKRSDDPSVQSLMNERERLYAAGKLLEAQKLTKQIHGVKARQCNNARYQRRREFFNIIF